MQTESISEDIFTPEDLHERSTAGKRLANYLIDVIIFYVLLFVFGILLALFSPTAADQFTNERTGFGLFERIITLLLYALYMSAVEAIFKGKSLGKLITKTRAVNLDGTQISASTAFARGFSRAVPFCAFSALGSPCIPWQDRWTKTMVINEKN
jgi:uncharacterized RDD family membrane protein YckC